jgi:spermidine synthase
MAAATHTAPKLLYALVALSGCAGLGFELLWIRALGRHFGTTAPALATVVATFMAGLALGNWVFGARADRHPRPFALYQQLELGIAVTGLAVSLFVLREGPWLDALSRFCEQAGPLAGPVRALTLAALMLVPATLMGGTLPLLARALAQPERAGEGLSLLYAFNTLGAIGGALVPDFVLVPRYGLTLAAFATAGCNLSVALGVRLLALRGALPVLTPPSPAREDARSEPVREPEPEPASAFVPEQAARGPQLAVALTLTACSGLSGMALEVLWSRTLQHWTAALVTSFGVLLAVYLAMLALGAFATRARATRATDPLRTASWLLGASAVATLAPIVTAYGWRDLERALWPRPSELRRLGLATEAVDALLHAAYLQALPCFLMGASFPFVAAWFLRHGRAGVSAGRLLTVNTLAGALGALVMTFVALPALGQQRSYLAVALLMSAVAALCSSVLASGLAQRVTGALGLGLVVAVALLLPRDVLLRAHFRSGSYVVAVREGSTTTAASALRLAYGQPYYAELLTPGVSMSNTGPPARRYMSMMAHAGMLAARGNERALLICYGVGNTARALLSHAGLRRLDVVDISREVLSLAPQFGRALGGNPLRDPRVRVFVDDGRHHLIVRDPRYDVITAEPPPPNHAGVVNLYSREFYRLAASRLAAGGVITQWLPVFELSDAEVRAMIAAFVAELRHTALLYGYKQHLILIGSQSPLVIDPARAARAAREPALAHNLRLSGIGDVHDVIGSVLKTDAELRREVRGVAAVTDDLPSIQYPYENVRNESSYTAGLSPAKEHALALLVPSADETTRRAVAAASRATWTALVALPLIDVQPLERAELALGRALAPALHARPMNDGLWTILGIDADHLRAAEAAVRHEGTRQREAVWTLARHALYSGEYAAALDRLHGLKPAADEVALHALLRGGALRGLGRASESEAAFRAAASASRDAAFRAAALSLGARALVPFAPSGGPFE